MLPLAHVAHYGLWFLYAIPILIVLAAIVRNMRAQRRLAQEDAEGEAG